MKLKSGAPSSICDLPNECIIDILSRISLQDACNVCMVSKMLKDVSESDIVWERFFPLNVKEMISDSVLNQFSSKKACSELYGGHLLLKGERMSISIKKHTGKQSIMIGSKELRFPINEKVHINDNSGGSWVYSSDDDSRFGEVAELIGASRYYIRCSVDMGMLSPETEYKVYLVMKYNKVTLGLKFPVAAGLIHFSDSKIVDGWHGIHLKECDTVYGQICDKCPVEREKGWWEVEVGEFYNHGGNGGVEIQVGDITNIAWKCGLILDGIELRPSRSVSS